jgi:LacI family transcriptional regulator
MPITIKDIAKLAGVSHATVSRSLNNSPLVADETKQKINELAQSLGFQFNANARSLSTNKSGTICIIYPESHDEQGVSMYYTSLIDQLRDSLEKVGIDIIVTFPKNNFTGENNIKRLIISRKIDGIIVVHPNLVDVDEQVLHFIEMSKMPYVFLHHYPNFALSNTVDAIYTDHVRGGYLAAEHLIKLGHKKIACITSQGQQKSTEFVQRTEGFKAAHNQYDIYFDNELIFYGDRDINSGYNIVKDNINNLLEKSVTAIFAQTDLMALGVMEALKELSYCIPDDFSVVGYDDIELVKSFKPNLTTVHQPREEIALLGCERLIDLINGKKKKKIVNTMLQPKLVIRESTKAIK